MLSLTEEALAGFSAGVVGTVIGFPLDTIKTHLQTASSSSAGSSNNNLLQQHNQKQPSIRHVASHLVRTEGVVRGLYRGVAPPLLSLSILNTLNFSAYSYFQSRVHGVRGEWNVRNAIAGAACGPAASAVSTVENLVKTQMQVQRNATSSWQCLQQLLAGSNRNGRGLSVLYTGHVINTARETTFLLTYFYMYEGLRTELAHPESLVARLLMAAGATTKSTSSEPTVPHDTHWWAIPLAGGCSGATAWAISFPLDCVRAKIQGRNLSNTSTSASAVAGRIGPVVRDLLATKGLWGLYAGVTPSLVRAFLVSGTRFSAYETTLWLIRGGRDMSYH